MSFTSNTNGDFSCARHSSARIENLGKPSQYRRTHSGCNKQVGFFFKSIREFCANLISVLASLVVLHESASLPARDLNGKFIFLSGCTSKHLSRGATYVVYCFPAVGIFRLDDHDAVPARSCPVVGRSVPSRKVPSD